MMPFSFWPRPPRDRSKSKSRRRGGSSDGAGGLAGAYPDYFLLAGAFFAGFFLAADFFAVAFFAGFFAALANVVLLSMESRESAHARILVQLVS